MTTWDTIVRAQPIADRLGFGADWRAFCETRDLKAADRASLQLHRARLGVADEEAEDLSALWHTLHNVMHSIKRRQA
jgi:hypothetical protein